MDPLDDEVRGWLRLARCDRLPARAAHELVRLAGGPAIFAEPNARKLRDLGLPRELSKRLAEPALSGRLDREQSQANRQRLTLVGLDDPRLPDGLRHLAVPPLVLTARGELDRLAGPAVAVVGSRRPSGYGLAQTERLARPLAESGLTIVSGLARGVDAAAHRATLDAGGRTVAVLGTGADRVYPKEHSRLADRIAENGALLTEFPPGTPPQRENFPRRNRIIVGLSLAVVVVEAAHRSGSLVTARWAGDEGRALLAVPGRVGEATAEGTLALIRDGATMACTAEDVIAELPWEARELLAAPGVGAAGPDDQDVDPLRVIEKIVPGSRALLDLLPPHDELHVDELVERARDPAAQVLEILFALELKGLVESPAGGRFRRTNLGRRWAAGGPSSTGPPPAPI